MPDLACGNQLPDRAGDVFHRHVRVDAVLVEQVDAVGAQPLQRGLGDGTDALRPAIHAVRRDAVPEAELGGDDDLITDGCERFANQLLVGERALGFSRVEEGHPVLERIADQFHRRLPARPGAVAEIQSQAAEADGGGFKPAGSQCAFFHAVGVRGGW
jgi:hypothetical protein